MIRVNLVPPEILIKARQRQLVLQAMVAGSLLAITVLCLTFVHWFALYRMENDYKLKQAKFAGLQAIVAQVEQLETATAAVHARLSVIEDLLKGRAFYPVFMSEFARTVPAGVKISNLTTASQSNNGLKLTISAVANSNDDIANWMKTLEGSSHFSGVELGAVTVSAAHISNFSITTMYFNKL